MARGEALLADATLAARRGLTVGSSVLVTTPSGVLELPLAGVTPTKFRSPSGDVMLSREVYRRWWHDGTITQAFVVLEPGASIAQVSDAIQSTLGREQRLRVMTRDELAEWYGAGVRRAYCSSTRSQHWCCSWWSSAPATRWPRACSSGRARSARSALGLTPADVAAQVFAQAAAIALVGIVLALAVGRAMSFAFVEGLVPSLLGWRLELRASWQVATTAALLGMAACFIGAFVPASRASRMSPIAALRYE